MLPNDDDNDDDAVPSSSNTEQLVAFRARRSCKDTCPLRCPSTTDDATSKLSIVRISDDGKDRLQRNSP